MTKTEVFKEVFNLTQASEYVKLSKSVIYKKTADTGFRP